MSFMSHINAIHFKYMKIKRKRASQMEGKSQYAISFVSRGFIPFKKGTFSFIKSMPYNNQNGYSLPKLK